MPRSRQLAAIAIALRKAGKHVRRVASPKTGATIQRAQNLLTRRSARLMDRSQFRGEMDRAEFFEGWKAKGRPNPAEANETLANMVKQQRFREARMTEADQASSQRLRNYAMQVRKTRNIAGVAGVVGAGGLAAVGAAKISRRRKERQPYAMSAEEAKSSAAWWKANPQGSRWRDTHPHLIGKPVTRIKGGQRYENGKHVGPARIRWARRKGT